VTFLQPAFSLREQVKIMSQLGLTDHSADESFQAIDCNGTDNQQKIHDRWIRV